MLYENRWVLERLIYWQFTIEKYIFDFLLLIILVYFLYIIIQGDKALGSKINNAEMTPIAFDRVYNLARAVAMRCNFKGVFVATKDPDCLQYIDEQNKLEKNRNDLLWYFEKKCFVSFV